MLVYAGIYAFGLFLLLRYTSAAHWDSNIILCVDVAAPRAGGGATEDHCWHVHRGAAEVEILLTKDPHEAALAQTVCFRNVFRVSRGIIRNSVGPGRGAAQVDGEPELLVAGRPAPGGAAGVVRAARGLGLQGVVEGAEHAGRQPPVQLLQQLFGPLAAGPGPRRPLVRLGGLRAEREQRRAQQRRQHPASLHDGQVA